MSPSIDTENWSATNEAIELDSNEISNVNSNSNTILAMEPDSNEKQIIKSNHKQKIMIKVRNGIKSYGSHIVLDHLNMSVAQGTIYALLGASGCGKTTLLSCIVGTKILNKGDMHFNGETMESIKRQGGLRSRVGYMPQELALNKEFTIKEVLLYFGRIYGMPLDVIEKQTDFLIKFLQLPDKDKQIRTMSGGQQRRTSFAVALLHSPQLLILDEPTVGVDPLLRKTIWEYLRKLVAATNTTVIITTHYIEEANDADVVGMMRNGKILVQGPPKKLLDSYECTKLEQLFLELSIQDEFRQVDKFKETTNSDFNQVDDEEIPNDNDDEMNDVADSKGKNLFSKNEILFQQVLGIAPWNYSTTKSDNHRHRAYFNRLYALVFKNLTHIYRQAMYVFFLLFFPAIEVLICCWAIGGPIWGLQFGIVNNELLNRNSLNNETLTCSDILSNRTCEDLLLSCDYAAALGDSITFDLRHFDTDEDALSSVKAGDIWGYILIPPDFTKLTSEKSLAGIYADNETVLNSRIKVQLDSTSLWTAGLITSTLYEIMQDMMKKMIIECEPAYVAEIVDGPLWFDDPVYGKPKPTLAEFISPGLILAVMYFAAVATTSMSYVIEKKQGMLERTVVAGVSTTEIITAQFLTQYVIIILQTLICFTLIIFSFGLTINSQFGWVVLLVLMQGSLGMLTGTFLSTICDEETVVMQLSTAVTIPCIVLGGLVWPLASMPIILRYFSQIFIPQTIANESLRSMLSRGWGISHPRVWPGFAITLGWMIALWIIGIIFAKRSVSPNRK